MADAIVDWGGAKPSITYGPKDNRVKESIGSLDHWVRKKIATSSDEEKKDNEEDRKNETLVRVVQSGGQDTKIDTRLGHRGPSFYHWSDNGEYAQCLKDYLESVCDVMMISHHEYLKDNKDRSNMKEYALLEPCEVLTEEEWLQGGLILWIDKIEEREVKVVHVDETQDEEAIIDVSKLKELLYFKTTSTGIIVGQDVKDYFKVPPD